MAFNNTNNKQLLDVAFRDFQNYQGQGKCYQPQPSASADNTYPSRRVLRARSFWSS